MAQRGVCVALCDVQRSVNPIYRTGHCDIVLGWNRWRHRRRHAFAKGVLLSNTTPIRNIGDYPELELILGELRKFPRNAVMDADEMAKAAGSPRAANMVLLGAVSNFLELPAEILTDAIRNMFTRKGEAIVQANLKAFDAGQKLTANV